MGKGVLVLQTDGPAVMEHATAVVDDSKLFETGLLLSCNPFGGTTTNREELCDANGHAVHRTLWVPTGVDPHAALSALAPPAQERCGEAQPS